MTYPTIRPELTLDFANSRQLDPRIIFSRTSGATYLNPDTGLITTASDHEARFEKEGLLIEESRTNLLIHSEDFNQWPQNAAVTVTLNSGSAPDGSNTANRVQPTTANNRHQVRQNVTTTYASGATYSLTVYAKAGLNDQILLYFASADFGFARGEFDLTALTATGLGGGTASIEQLPGNWRKLVLTVSATASGTVIPVHIGQDDVFGVGDPSQDFYVWGAQLTQGRFPTSYIPTSGSTVTRAPELCSILGTNYTSLFGTTLGPGSIFHDVKVLGEKGNTNGGTFSSFGTNNNSQFISFTRYDNRLNIGIVIPGASFVPRYYDLTGVTVKSAVSWTDLEQPINDQTNASHALDGALYPGNMYGNNGNVLNTECNRFGIGRTIRTSTTYDSINGHIARLAYYSRRLTDEQLETLTL